MKCDFQGWATKANLKCSDGRTIMPNAFKDDDGKTVPLVYNHKHDDPLDVLGHAVLENRPEGVWAYCFCNDTERGKVAKQLVHSGDVTAFSIYANKLRQNGGNVMHGCIRELSLVLAGANPGATIESVYFEHGDDEDGDEAAFIYYGESEENGIVLSHSDEEKKTPPADEKEDKKEGEETVEDVFNTLSDKQKTVVYALIGQALENAKGSDEEDDEENDNKGDSKMKHNVFDNDSTEKKNVLTHSDGAAIIELAKNKQVGSLQHAMELYAEENFSDAEGETLEHGFDEIDVLFPDFKDVRPGAPEIITNDQNWIGSVLDKVHKTPYSRIRTKQTDTRNMDNGYGYQKGEKKKVPGNAKFIHRTTDPQTVYRKDALERDDIVDITDFDVVAYQYGIMVNQLKEELGLAILIGDGRDVASKDKIQEEHIRPIWLDNEIYTIHYSVTVDGEYPEDIANAISLTGDVSDYTENYKFTEGLIAAALLSREQYKGPGTPDFFCDPHYVNLMLLTRDLNGRRIYNDKSDLAKALNVGAIHEVEQFRGKVRYGSAETHDADKKYSLLGLFVNLNNYTLGATKGGEITKFQDFDIDFNQEKFLIETRLSGALTRIASAIALEICETVEEEPGE